MKTLKNLRVASLTHVEAGQFIKRHLNDLTKANVNTTTDVQIKNYVIQMQSDTVLYDKALLQIQKKEETEILADLDDERDMSFSILSRQLRVYELSKIPAEITAYKSLIILFDNFKNLTTANYEAETNTITNLLQDLAKTPYAAHVTTLKLSPFITRLTTDNDNFNTHYTARSTDTASTVIYDTKAIRKSMLRNYSNFAKYVLLLSESNNTAYYNGILDIINNVRGSYSNLLAIRAGIHEAKGTKPSAN